MTGNTISNMDYGIVWVAGNKQHIHRQYSNRCDRCICGHKQRQHGRAGTRCKRDPNRLRPLALPVPARLPSTAVGDPLLADVESPPITDIIKTY